MSSDIVAMDMAQPENSTGFSKQEGFFLSRSTAWLLALLFVSGLVATGLLVYYYAPKPEPIHGQHQLIIDDSVRVDFESPSSHAPTTSERSHTSKTESTSKMDPTTTMSSSGISMTREDEDVEEEIDVRLPKSLKPLHYVVKLQPFVNGNFSIFGYVEVQIEALEPTTEIVLHITDIVTHNDTVRIVPMDDSESEGLGILKHEYDPKRHFYIAHLEKPLEGGKTYLLAMNFLGYLNDKLKGFYRSSYKDEEGNERWLATTQFQPTHARKAFPCFDEPGMKATFDIFLGREENMSSISNMPLAETLPLDDQEGWYWDRYNTSVPMSTYLVAFVVSDFVNMNATSENGTFFRVWARESAIDQADYSLDIGPRILTYFEDYFHVPYPLPKQDMIALPDFAAGAMENWGLITYRETAMLFDPMVSAPMNKRWVALVVAHELAHQWFGNIVTAKWWDDLWLNEGFASFVQYIGMDYVEPSWKVMDQFVIDTVQNVFFLDSLDSSHPVSVPVGNPEQIIQIFDGISYSKGASLIRMMSNFLTEGSLRKGLSNYLEAFQFDNAEQDDLWEYLTMAAHEDGTLPDDLTVKTIMDTWTLQMGYPVIKVTRSSDGTSAIVTQERFVFNAKEGTSDDHDYKWWVPLNFASPGSPNFTETNPSVWMKDTESEITISTLPSNDEWVIFNLQQTGFYRVNYDEDNWNLIIKQLQSDPEVIHSVNRAQVIDDAMDLARAGLLSYETAMAVYSYLGNETEYVPWKSAVNNLGYLTAMFKRTGSYGALKEYIKDLVVPLYESVGFEDSPSDPLLTQFLRKTAMSWACKLGHQECLDNVLALFRQWMEDPHNTEISPNIRPIVYCRAIEAGDEKEWEFAWNMYLETNVASEKSQLLKALGCTKKIWLLSRYLEMAFTENSGIRRQDASTVFSAVAENDFGKPLAWNFIRENWTKIYKYFGKANKRVISSATSGFNTDQQLRELEIFSKENEDELEAASRTVEIALERINNDIMWMDDNFQTIVDWLETQGYSSKLNNV